MSIYNISGLYDTLLSSTPHQTFPALQTFKPFLETPPIDKDAVKNFVEQKKIEEKSMYFMHALSTVILIICTSWASVYTGTAEVIGSRLVLSKFWSAVYYGAPFVSIILMSHI